MERKVVSVIMITLLSTSMSILALPVSGLISGIELKYRTPYSLPQGWTYVLVEASIFDGIETSLNRYATDLESIDGFSVGIYTVSTSTTPTAIRLFLQQALPDGLVGCLLVGDVREPYYECYWWDVYYRVQTDFYYMDLDGVWIDTDGNGAYDEHSGEASAEIWVGTLQPSMLSGDSIWLLNNYFEKNHLYRTGKLSLPKRALSYLDDGGWDLLWFENFVNNTVKVAYDETVIVRDPEVTVASDYRERLLEGYEWIYLVCHGTQGGPPGGHTFAHHGGWDGTVYGWDYRSIDPHVFFYVFVTCYAAFGYNNVAMSSVFTDTYGLLSIASEAMTGKEGTYTEFYKALSEGKCVGEAHLEDIEIHGSKIPSNEYLWTIVGDPSLHIKGYPFVITIDDLRTDIEELGSEGEIDNQGIVKSLIAKLNVAQKLVDKGKIDEAKTILADDFIPQVQNLSGIHITEEAADILIQSAEYILAHL